MRKTLISGLAGVAIFVFSAAAWAAPYDEVLNRWQKTQKFSDAGETIAITVTYYSSEYIEALVQSEAEKNLWTADELEMHKYQLLKTLRLDDTIPVKFQFEGMGPTLHLAPFGQQVWIWIGKKRYDPVDFDPRFNFGVTEKIDGMVYFPRFDEKTGKDLLEGVGSVKVVVSGGISMAVKPVNVDFIWDVGNDDPSRLYGGQAGSRLEMDRLIKRLANLNREKEECEQRLGELNAEISTVEARMKELQQQ